MSNGGDATMTGKRLKKATKSAKCHKTGTICLKLGENVRRQRMKCHEIVAKHHETDDRHRASVGNGQKWAEICKKLWSWLHWLQCMEVLFKF